MIRSVMSRRPARGGTPDALVVMLHGLGANGADLMGLAPYLEDAAPGAEFLAPDAHEPCDMAPMGFQWFSLLDRRMEVMAPAAAAASPVVNQFLDEELAKRGLPPERLVLLGFSQGTMMSLQVALRRPQAIGGVIGFSGALMETPSFDADVTARPPVLLIHGTDDGIVPFGAMAKAEGTLKRVGVEVGCVTCPGVGHSIDDRGLAAAEAFLSRVLG
ncbi:MAG: alpha/beta fold hydrolase [Alphaproteobacteria bacterium]|nr:alpha/beta fold hydrolase [Alphaproteobacteria bacterium]